MTHRCQGVACPRGNDLGSPPPPLAFPADNPEARRRRCGEMKTGWFVVVGPTGLWPALSPAPTCLAEPPCQAGL